MNDLCEYTNNKKYEHFPDKQEVAECKKCLDIFITQQDYFVVNIKTEKKEYDEFKSNDCQTKAEMRLLVFPSHSI